MSSIICATRAGEGSRTVQTAAIQQAKANNQHLVFLYVIELERLNKLDESIQPFVRVELYWLAKTLLHIAERRALSAGINAELVIREGNIRDEICGLVTSLSADHLMLGAPRRNVNVFGEEGIEIFAQSIRDSTGIQVEIVRPPVASYAKNT